jgi:hypothetical protein
MPIGMSENIIRLKIITEIVTIIPIVISISYNKAPSIKFIIPAARSRILH